MVFLPSSLIVLSTLIEQFYSILFVRKLASNGDDEKRVILIRLFTLELLKTVMEVVDKQYNNTMIDKT